MPVATSSESLQNTAAIQRTDAPLLVYLDHSDLVDIADGKAVDLDDLTQAFAVSGAHLLISWVHLLDLHGSTPDTKARWINAAAALAPLRFTMEVGANHPIDREGLARLVEDSASDISIMGQAVSQMQSANEYSRAAMLAGPNLSPGQVRDFIKAIFDNQPGRLASQEEGTLQLQAILAAARSCAESMGIDKDTMLAALGRSVDKAITDGDVPLAVKLHRGLDVRRRPRESDYADELHLKFAPCAAIFTVDGNVAHALKSIFKRSVPIPGRKSTDGFVFAYRSRELARVANAMRVLAEDICR